MRGSASRPGRTMTSPRPAFPAVDAARQTAPGFLRSWPAGLRPVRPTPRRARARLPAMRLATCTPTHTASAYSKQWPQAPLHAPGFEPIAPLHRAIEIVNALTGSNQIQQARPIKTRFAHLTGKHPRIDLVELAKAICHVTASHPRKPVERATDHLVVDRSEALSDPDRFCPPASPPPPGSPSSKSAKTPARNASHAFSGASGCPSRRRRARWSQPLATAASPRKAAVSQASHTAIRAAPARSSRSR